MAHNQQRLWKGTLVACAAVALASALIQTAPAAPVQPVLEEETSWLSAPLGIHRFGHLSKPETIVASAGPKDVGFWEPEVGEDGAPYGPWSYEVAQDGSVWLLDVVNERLLVWSPDRPSRPTRTVQLPFRAPVDFALGPGGLLYVFSAPAGEPHYLYALTSAGEVLWKERTIMRIFNSQLRMGPDGTLYYHVPGVSRWVPVATPNGGPIARPEQRRLASLYQPLPGGLRLVSAFAPHEARFALIDQDEQVVRAWRVTSRTRLWPGPATPARIGGDLVVALDVSRQAKSDFLLEDLVVRLGKRGGIRQVVSLDPHAVVVDSPITGLRVGPNGDLYQLRSDPAQGVSIARYSLRPTTHAPPAEPTRPAEVAKPAAAPAVTEPATTAPSVSEPLPAAPVVRPAQSTTPKTSGESGRWLAPLAAALGAGALVALGVWLLYRRRHPVGLPT
jgi:hypothetical protein